MEKTFELVAKAGDTTFRKHLLTQTKGFAPDIADGMVAGSNPVCPSNINKSNTMKALDLAAIKQDAINRTNELGQSADWLVLYQVYLGGANGFSVHPFEVYPNPDGYTSLRTNDVYHTKAIGSSMIHISKMETPYQWVSRTIDGALRLIEEHGHEYKPQFDYRIKA